MQAAGFEIPRLMRAAVYHGESVVSVEEVPTPEICAGEILIRVEACGVCHTDLKKVEHNLLPPPRIYGHETAGIVARAGAGVTRFAVGDRVIVFHHIPCRACFYCSRKLYAQCLIYKKVGVTAGFTPAGGGFSQYVRVMDWIVENGVEKIPDGISFEEASFVEPVNTCLKAVDQCAARADDLVLVMGQGPIGLLFTMILHERGIPVVATDTIPCRLSLSRECGASESWDPRSTDVVSRIESRTDQRGADIVIVATAAPGLVAEAIRCSRPGARILLFAQTSHTERIEFSGADICVGERVLFGCYSADVDLQAESADLVFRRRIPVARLISDRFPLGDIEAAFHLAQHPTEWSLKVIVKPQELN